MADIFDLAKSINRRRQQASQGYASGWEDLPMQVMKMMDTRAKEKRVSLKQDAEMLQKLIQSADTEEEINALTNKANSYLKETTDADMPFYGEFINNQVNEQRDGYYEAKNAMEWMSGKLDERTPSFDSVYSAIKRQESGDRAQRHNNPGAHIWIPELEEKFGAKKGDSFTGDDGQTYYTALYDDTNKGDEASRFVAKRMWDKHGGDVSAFAKEYSGSSDADTLKGYEDTINQNLKNNNYLNYSVDDMMGFSLDEIERRREEFERLAPGLQAMGKYGFKFNKGNYADATLKRNVIEYGERLEATLKAHLTGGILTEEEAGSILRGTYKEDKASVLKKINANMSDYRSRMAKIDKALLDELDDNNLYKVMDAEELDTSLTGASMKEELQRKRESLQSAWNLERDRQYAWEGIPQTARKSILDKAEDDGSNIESKNEITSIVDATNNKDKAKNAPIESTITDAIPSKTNIDDKRYSTKNLNKLPQLKKSKGKFVTTDDNNNLVEWDNMAYHPNLKKDVPILKGKSDMDTYYWDNGWKHLKGQSPGYSLMSDKEIKREIEQSKELSKLQKEALLKDMGKAWQWIKNKVLKTGSIPSSGTAKIISIDE